MLSFKLNQQTATKKGLLTPVMKIVEGIETYILVLQTDDNKAFVIGKSFGERKILNLAYKFVYGTSEY